MGKGEQNNSKTRQGGWTDGSSVRAGLSGLYVIALLDYYAWSNQGKKFSESMKVQDWLMLVSVWV